MVDAHDGETYTSEGSRLIWIDCEMTGLDIFGGDELVEVSVVPTDFDLNVLDEGVDYVIKPSQKAVDHMNDFVRAMHTRSGLINEWEHGLSLDEAQAKVIEYVRKFTPAGVKPLLAGNTIGSDKKFLDHYMPELMENLHYRTNSPAAGIRPSTSTVRRRTAATARSPTSSNRSTNCVTTARRSWPRCPVRTKRRRRPSPLKSRKPACSTRTDSTTPARGTA